MKEYLEKRLIELKKEYSESLTEGGNIKSDVLSNERSVQWSVINDKKSRIDEIKKTIEFFKENNYTNL